MDVTQDVILDLLPVYFSGDASASTRTLVDEFLARDPVFADRVKREWAEPIGPGAVSRPHPDVALRSLHRTRRLLAWQRWLFGFAMAFTVLPLSMEMTFSGGRLTEFHFLIRDYPGLLAPFLAAGAVCWMAYIGLHRKLQVRT